MLVCPLLHKRRLGTHRAVIFRYQRCCWMIDSTLLILMPSSVEMSRTIILWSSKMSCSTRQMLSAVLLAYGRSVSVILPLTWCLQPDLLEGVVGALLPSQVVVHTPPQMAPSVTSEAPNVPEVTWPELALAARRLIAKNTKDPMAFQAERGSWF